MSSHSFGHFYAEQCQSVRQNGERSSAQIEPEITHVFVFADNLTVEIEFIESRRQIYGVTGYVKRFEFLYRSLYRVGEVRQHGDEVVFLFVHGGDVVLLRFSAFSQNALYSRRGILNVRSGLSVEVKNFIVTERYIFDFTVGKRAENDRAGTDLTRYSPYRQGPGFYSRLLRGIFRGIF